MLPVLLHFVLGQVQGMATNDRALLIFISTEEIGLRSGLDAWLYAVTKRSLDVIASTAILLLCLPLIAVTAIAVMLESSGPVLFRQARVGRHGVRFHMLKFRSMFCDAELARAALGRERQGPVFKLRGDPRITRVGRFLRRTSLDELPQFLNVILGHMSLVGPRPLPAKDIDEWETRVNQDGLEQIAEWLRSRHSVRPGISGLWQVRGRSLLPFEDWVHYDMEYVRCRGWALDLKILALTPVVTLLGWGAM